MKSKFVKFVVAVLVAAVAIFGGYNVAPGVVEGLLCNYAGFCAEASK